MSVRDLTLQRCLF